MSTHIYIHIYVISFLKRGHKFQRLQRGVYGRVWREKQKVKNDAIILLSQKTEIIYMYFIGNKFFMQYILIIVSLHPTPPRSPRSSPHPHQANSMPVLSLSL